MFQLMSDGAFSDRQAVLLGVELQGQPGRTIRREGDRRHGGHGRHGSVLLQKLCLHDHRYIYLHHPTIINTTDITVNSISLRAWVVLTSLSLVFHDDNSERAIHASAAGQGRGSTAVRLDALQSGARVTNP